MKRVLTIDIMRGLTLFLMLFVNDLFTPNVPSWLVHTDADFDGMGLADWVFPGFLFMVGMAVPFAIRSRIKNGHSNKQIVLHILERTVSLLIIGVLMMNTSRLNPELTGLNRNLWALLMYVSVFLIWNYYQTMNRKIVLLLKGIGIAGLLALVLIFRSGTAEDSGWLTTGWWGILGLIGWGYFVTALIYLVSKEDLLKTGLFWLLFLMLNIMSQLGLLSFLEFMRPVFFFWCHNKRKYPAVGNLRSVFQPSFKEDWFSAAAAIFGNWNLAWHFGSGCRLFPEKLVYYLQNKSHAQLGINLHRHQYFTFCAAFYSARCLENYWLEQSVQAGRPKLAHHLPGA